MFNPKPDPKPDPNSNPNPNLNKKSNPSATRPNFKKVIWKDNPICRHYNTSKIIADGEHLLVNFPGVRETVPVFDDVTHSGRAELRPI